jgi:hypothetical protein
VGVWNGSISNLAGAGLARESINAAWQMYRVIVLRGQASLQRLFIF